MQMQMLVANACMAAMCFGVQFTWVSLICPSLHLLSQSSWEGEPQAAAMCPPLIHLRLPYLIVFGLVMLETGAPALH